ncbi:MAG: tRNA preQ1(34) S-adenosylmethionine ribosyltransferase-isomerase QueA [Spirochaetota bacterium]
MDYFNLENYDFPITEDRIRKYPLKERESSKLLVVDKKGNIIKDTIFDKIIDFIETETLIVFNDSKVIKSRLFGIREKNNKLIEIMIIKKIESNLYLSLVKNQKTFKENEKIHIVKKEDNKIDEVEYEIIVKGKEKEGLLISFNKNIDFETIEEFGKLPIPPFLEREAEEIDEIYYQNIFSKNKGSVASPTAGLHFTESILSRLKEKNIDIAYITLHVGWGTFAPIRTEDIRNHEMHKEWYSISEETAIKINEKKRKEKKIIACGTTSLRTLEGCYKDNGKIEKTEGETSIFIYPPYEFKVVDGLITNFHTPKSSLLLLVSAFAGYENIRKYYNYALENNYMFFSYGDAMFIVP